MYSTNPFANPVTDTGTPCPTSEVREQLQQLDKAVSELSGVVEALEFRLAPVLRPRTEEGNCPDGKIGDPALAPLAYEIYCYADYIRFREQRLSALLAHLAI